MKVLLVEDSFLVGNQLKRLITAEGHDVLGPFATAEDAMSALETEQVDWALLDFSLRGGDSAPVAEELSRRGCAFAFVTGYREGEGLPARFEGTPHLRKPIDLPQLRRAIQDVQGS